MHIVLGRASGTISDQVLVWDITGGNYYVQDLPSDLFGVPKGPFTFHQPK